jgi:hypothetical protein
MQASIEAAYVFCLPGPIRSHEANLLGSLWGVFLEHTIIVNRVQSIRSEMRVYTILYSQQDAQVYYSSLLVLNSHLFFLCGGHVFLGGLERNLRAFFLVSKKSSPPTKCSGCLPPAPAMVFV